MRQRPLAVGALVRPRPLGIRTWSGIGHVAVGMACQGYDLHLTRYDERGWRATSLTPSVRVGRSRRRGERGGGGMGGIEDGGVLSSRRAFPLSDRCDAAGRLALFGLARG